MAEDADALELLALQVDDTSGVRTAGPRTGSGSISSFLRPELLVHLDLDGQAVAVPAGDIRRVEASHGLAT